jgi:hypothetical protein
VTLTRPFAPSKRARCNPASSLGDAWSNEHREFRYQFGRKSFSTDKVKAEVIGWTADMNLVGWAVWNTPHITVDFPGQKRVVIDGVIQGEPLPAWMKEKGK